MKSFRKPKVHMRGERGQGLLVFAIFVIVVTCIAVTIVSGIEKGVQKRQEQKRAEKVQQQAKNIDFELLNYNYQESEFDSSVTVKVTNNDSNPHSLFFFAKMVVSYSLNNGEKNSETVWNGTKTINIEPNTTIHVEIPFGNFSLDGGYGIPPWKPAESPAQICVDLQYVDNVDVPFLSTSKLIESRACEPLK